MSRTFLKDMEDLGCGMAGYDAMLADDELDEMKAPRRVKSLGVASLVPLEVRIFFIFVAADNEVD
jgi:hypothetical protein